MKYILKLFNITIIVETHAIVFPRGYLNPLTYNICVAVCMTYLCMNYTYSYIYIYLPTYIRVFLNNA